MKIQVSASLLSAKFLTLGLEIEKSIHAGVDSFHLDVMDGHLAPNLSYGPPVIQAIRKATTLPLDAHLMIDHPWIFLDDYFELGLNSIFIHAESYDTHSIIDPTKIKLTPRSSTQIDLAHLEKDLAAIRNNGVQAGITLNPGTPVSCILPILPFCDRVLVMSVNPGYSGQKFISNALAKISDIRRHFSGDIVVDGGVNKETAPDVVKAGANVLVTASYLYGSDDYHKAVRDLIPNPSPS